jgi:hypothetical protein
MIKKIKIDYNDLKNIKKAEKLKNKLENLNFSLIKTIKINFNNYVLIYKK